MECITIDIETRSDRDIMKCGVYAYADSPYFDILLFSYSIDGGAVQVIDLANGEEQIKKLFVKAVNQLVEHRAEIISEYDNIINIVLSTETLEKQYTKLNFEMSQLETENEELIDLNATVALDQDEYRKKRDAIVEKYEKLKAQSEKVMQEMTDKEVRKGAIIRFWKEFEKLNFLTEFDNLLWVSLVDTLTVYSKEKILFTFRDGNMVELPLET